MELPYMYSNVSVKLSGKESSDEEDDDDDLDGFSKFLLVGDL